jgi:hypothetical protein
VTGLTFLSVIIIAALVGSLTALFVDAVRAEARRFDTGLADLTARLRAERARVGDVTRYGTVGHPGGHR